MEKICVAVRLRPPVSEEASTGTFWKVEDNRISLHKAHGTPISGVSYAFDHVFDESCTNARVYELLTKDIIHAAVDGFNGTAFAYGQTSSGKTFTMNGSESDPGIIHWAVKDIFGKLQKISNREFLIRVSYMEIYNEEINDLLTVENQKLQIHESLERGIFVSGLREEIVNSAEQVLELIESGEVNRHFGETNMNVRSSRSHTIFRMIIESKGKDADSSSDYASTDAIRVSVLNLVDLAGSERIAKTGADGVRLKEGKHINKSLMVLGNVINKLSDGAKQRGHIPYRDSKLTRILQPALGGNAKTSIICTLAPEEVHVEETKGTLQFASRAKRITNCAQVNEIMTDAALLKRQKLEIEELRKKLQGSRAEVLEQEILKLRNEMLKYELEREKLEMELEEERKSHKERDLCIREQQMKIDNLNSLVTFSDGGKNSSQDSERHSLREEWNDSNSICQEDLFRTPCFKEVPNAFVVKRSNYPRLPDYSPLPDTLSNVADEDTWFKMNKGYIADLDSIKMTPARKVQSLPSSEPTVDCSNKNYELEVQNLRRQLELVTEDKHELERKHSEQLLLNNQLIEEISELKQEALRNQEIPRKLCESISSCKDNYKDTLSQLQSFASDRKCSTAKFLFDMSEISTSVFSALESHFSMAMNDQRSSTIDDSLIQVQCKVLCDRLKDAITSLVSPETSTARSKQYKDPSCNCANKLDAKHFEKSSGYETMTRPIKFSVCLLYRLLLSSSQGSILGGETACCQEKVKTEFYTVKQSYHDLEKELDRNNRLLEVSQEKYLCFERELQFVKYERDSLLKTVSESSQKLVEVTEEKENILADLNSEVQRKKDLEEEIKQFSVAFAKRQRSFMSLHTEFISKIGELRAQNPVSAPRPLGY